MANLSEGFHEDVAERKAGGQRVSYAKKSERSGKSGRSEGRRCIDGFTDT
jgi:hypothetical protein